jgi:digeranylgeranylglycerophospholipid reductase
MQKKRSVAVIGAGTSGLIAARDLASFGIPTVVYEQKTRLGYPPRASGIVSIRGLESLRIGYEKAITNTLYGANIHAGSAVMQIISKKPQAHVLDRVRLNEICYEECVEKGAEVREGVRVDSKILGELHKNNIIVGADGILSAVAKYFSMGTINRYILTYKASFKTNVENENVVDLFFDNALAPRFFAWMCPNEKDILEVGIGIDSRKGNSKAAFDRFLRTKEVSNRLNSSKMIDGYASMIPMQTARKIVDEENEVLLVGDAAGQVKQTTGGGIVFGGNAAMTAARVIEEYVRDGKSLRRYEQLFKKGFGADIALHGLISRLYGNLDVKKIEFLMNTARILGLEGFLSKYGDMDKPSVMLKRFLLRGFVK